MNIPNFEFYKLYRLIAVLSAAVVRPKFEFRFSTITLHFNKFLHASTDFAAPSFAVNYTPDITKPFFAGIIAKTFVVNYSH